MLHFAGWPYRLSDAPLPGSPPSLSSKRVLHPLYRLRFHTPDGSSWLLAQVAQGFPSNTCSELQLQHRPLSWGSALQETARDLRGVNEPADSKLRSKAVLTPRLPILLPPNPCPQEAGVSRIIFPCEPHFHALTLPTLLVAWKKRLPKSRSHSRLGGSINSHLGYSMQF